MKKILVIALLLGALGATAILYLKPFQTNNVTHSPYEAIPKNIAIFGYTTQFNQLFEKMDTLSYSQQLSEASWRTNVINHYQYLSQLANAIDSNINVINESANVFGIANGGSGTPSFLIISKLPEAASKYQEDISNLLPEIEAPYSYNGHPIYQIKNFSNQPSYTITVYANLLIASANPALVEASVDAVRDGSSITQQASFQQLDNQNKGQADMHLYLNYKALGSLSGVFAPQNMIPAFQHLEEIGDWARLEVSFLKDEVVFHGYSSYSNQSDLLARLSAGYPSENELANYLPNNTAYFNRVAAGKNSYFTTDDISKSYLSSWVDGAYAHFILETFDENYNDRAGVVVLAKEPEDAFNNLTAFGNGALEKVDSVMGQYVYQLNTATELNELYPNSLVQFEGAYLGFFQNAVFFSPSMSVVKSCLQKNKEGNTLQRDIAYTDFVQTIASQSNVQTYCQPNLMAKALGTLFKSNYLSPNEIQRFSWQLSNVKGNFYTTGLISYAQQNVAQTTKLWEAKLDAPAIMQPQLMINHDDQSKEIVTQDELGNFYLINASGEIQFKILVDEPIMGEVHQIDFYKNGKLQYVFNTASKVYLIDRLGRSVADFPRNLPAKATAPMLVAKYEGKGNYRYFFACENGSVYGYEIDYKPLTGWSPVATPGIVSTPLNHVQIDAKDYIYFVTNTGDFYAYSRSAEERFKPVAINVAFAQDFKVLNNKFVNGANGKFYSITTDGVLAEVPMTDTTMNHFAVPMTADYTDPAFIWYQDASFSVVRSQIEKLAAYELTDSIEQVDVVPMNNQTYFLLRADGFSYLIDGLGSLHPEFPMPSAAPLNFLKMYENKEKVMIVAKEDGKLGAYELKFAN